MYEMKGYAKVMLVGQSAKQGRVELARFPDGSWSIRKDGPTVGVWEPHEEAECFRVFAMLAGLDAPPDGGDLVVVVRHNRAAQIATLN